MFIRSALFSLLVVNISWVNGDDSEKVFLEISTDPLDVTTGGTVQSYLAKTRIFDPDSEFEFGKIVSAFHLQRHGTREPKPGKIDEMKKLEESVVQIVANLKDEKNIPFTKEDYDKLIAWRFDETKHTAQGLTEQGQIESRKIADNYKRRYPEIFGSKDAVSMKYTDSGRTADTFKAFADELFGIDVREKINFEPTDETFTLLKSYKLCPSFIEQQKTVKAKHSEMKKFEKSKLYKNVIEEVNKRLRFESPNLLKKHDIKLMYDMYRYEESWNPNVTSPWCSVFTKDELKVLAFAKDLGSYYEFGHGSEMNENIQCSTIHDMVSHLKSPSDKILKSYFTHSSGLLLHLTAMGAFKDDDQLTADTFSDNRKWNSGFLSPFAANLFIVSNGTHVKCFLNEKVMPLPGCNGGVCTLEDFTSRYKQFDTCETKFCTVAGLTAAQLKLQKEANESADEENEEE